MCIYVQDYEGNGEYDFDYDIYTKFLFAWCCFFEISRSKYNTLYNRNRHVPKSGARCSVYLKVHRATGRRRNIEELYVK